MLENASQNAANTVRGLNNVRDVLLFLSSLFLSNECNVLRSKLKYFTTRNLNGNLAIGSQSLLKLLKLVLVEIFERFGNDVTIFLEFLTKNLFVELGKNLRVCNLLGKLACGHQLNTSTILMQSQVKS